MYQDVASDVLPRRACATPRHCMLSALMSAVESLAVESSAAVTPKVTLYNI